MRRRAKAVLPEHLRDRARVFAAGWVEAAREVAEESAASWLEWQRSGGRLPVEVD